MAFPTTDHSELQGFVRQLRPEFMTAAAFSFVINLLMLVPTLYMLQVYDRVLTSRNADTLLMLTILAAATYLLLSSIEWVRSQLLIRAGIRLEALLSPRTFEASFTAMSRSGRGGAQALNDALTVRQFLTGNGLFALFDAPWTPIFLWVIFVMHPWLGWLSLFGALLLLFVAWLNEKLTRDVLTQANDMQGAATQTATTYFRNHETVAAMGMLGALRERWLQRQKKVIELQTLASGRAGLLSSLSKLIRMLQQMAILGLGAWLAIKGEITPGAMIASSILMGRALAPVDLAIASWRQLVMARGAYGRLGQLLEAAPAPPPTLDLPAPTGEVTVENITIVPPGAKVPSVLDLSFQIRKGMAIGVIGPSASGKTSLARALTGVWLPVKGAVRIDGASLQDWNRDKLGPYIGYLPQSIELFEGTVAENIARFGPLDSDRIVKAAQLAGIHDMILHLPDAYETVVGVDGAALSGGQRQRLALARAVYGMPSLVVLDEPNSNLDEKGEEALVNAVNELKRQGTTVVLVTHRRGTLECTDGLLVMNAGKLQVYGPTAQVLRQLAGDAAPKPVEGARP
ncbi:MAG: type I secretion system permease/ATPase [Pseudomonadota bacterium]